MRRVRQIYPGITRAAVEMAYDNGGIHRFRSEATVVRRLSRFMDTVDLEPQQLREIDQWLSLLSEDLMQTAVAGEEAEMLALMRRGPPFAHKLLNDMFNAGVP